MVGDALNVPGAGVGVGVGVETGLGAAVGAVVGDVSGLGAAVGAFVGDATGLGAAVGVTDGDGFTIGLADTPGTGTEAPPADDPPPPHAASANARTPIDPQTTDPPTLKYFISPHTQHVVMLAKRLRVNGSICDIMLYGPCG